MTLEQYKKKRDFKKTPEPRNNQPIDKNKQLYIIQKHDASHLHYDFRLQIGDVLKSWAVPKGPSLDPNVKRLAVHVEDHPLSYGSFEGIIPQGEYGGGTVMLWDKGTWQTENSLEKAYQKGHMIFTLRGKKLKGEWQLIQIKKDPKNWLLMKINDKEAQSQKEFDILKQEPLSIKSGKSLDEIAKNTKKNVTHQNKKSSIPVTKKKAKTSPIKLTNLTHVKKSVIPETIRPQLATLVDKAPSGNNWLHELKFDGYRIITIINNSEIKLLTRNQNDWTDKLNFLTQAFKKLNLSNIVLDGELVALDEKQVPNFQTLQNTLNHHDKSPLIYYLFDIIYYDGYDLTGIPLLARKKLLEQLIDFDNQSIIRYSDHQLGAGKTMFGNACQLGLEGIISKEINSPYLQARSRHWLKLKCVKRQEFIVGGYTKPQGTRSHFGSLLLGIYDKNNKIKYCGHVGTGFTQDSLFDIYQLLTANKTTKMPFVERPPKISHVTWVKPNIIIEVEFIEWTEDGILRTPSFKGIRTDKSPQQVTMEIPLSLQNGENIMTPLKDKTKENTSKMNFSFSHPDRILFTDPNITKIELAEFYQNINKWILPHIINRPLSLVRCPQGGLEHCFYQKHIDENLPDGIYTIDLEEKHSSDKYLYIKDLNGLMALVQLGVLEIHPWGCHIDQIEKPDLITFDLDPGPGVKWEKVVQIAHYLNEQLENIGLKSFVKTTGGKGLHIVIPLLPDKDWVTVKSFAHAFVNLMVEQNPKDLIGTMAKSKREGKIFIDYLRNNRGATSVAAYSTRAKPGAPISTPLSWEELTSKIQSASYTIHNLLQRLNKLKNDPWENYFKTKQTLDFKSI